MRRDSLEEAGRWLRQARIDLDWADDLAQRGGYHIACFLAQQVAEKALKAYLYSRGEETVFGHSVQRLCADAAAYDESFAEPGRRWAVLDAYYIPTRYPNGLPDSIPALVFTAEAAAGAVILAREVVVFVGAILEAPAKAG